MSVAFPNGILCRFCFQGVAKPEEKKGEPSASYVRQNVTNRADSKIKQEIDDAEDSIENVSFQDFTFQHSIYSINTFSKILEVTSKKFLSKHREALTNRVFV